MKDVEWIALAVLAFLAQGRKLVTRPLVREAVCECSRAEVTEMFVNAFPRCVEPSSSKRPECVRAPRHPIFTEAEAKGKEPKS